MSDIKTNDYYAIAQQYCHTDGWLYRYMSRFNDSVGTWTPSEKGAIAQGETHAKLIMRHFPVASCEQLERQLADKDKALENHRIACKHKTDELVAEISAQNAIILGKGDVIIELRAKVKELEQALSDRACDCAMRGEGWEREKEQGKCMQARIKELEEQVKGMRELLDKCADGECGCLSHIDWQPKEST